MLIRVRCAVAARGPVFEPGDIIDWKPDDTAQRLIDANLADPIKKAPEGVVVKSYTEPAPKPEDAWPPKQAPRKRRRDSGSLAS